MAVNTQPLSGDHGDRAAEAMIGELLTTAGLITRKQLATAIQLSQASKLSLGMVLIDSGILSENLIRSALTAQTLTRDGLLHIELAAQALEQSAARNIPFQDALKEIGWQEESYKALNSVGRLLLDANAITKDDLVSAAEICLMSGLLLMKVLVARNVISEVTAYIVLNMQQMLRENLIERDDAIKKIQETFAEPATLGDWLTTHQQPDTSRGPLRLGELLCLSKVLSEHDLLTAVETSLNHKIMIGQVLLRENLVSEPVLHKALSLQKQVQKGSLTAAEATQRLGYTRSELSRQSTISAPRLDGPLASMSAEQARDVNYLQNALQNIHREKENLAHRLISDQEELKHSLARDLHDTIIADLLMLKRYLAGDKKMTPEQTIGVLDDVVVQLREICSDFAPNHLNLWGLATTIKDLVNRTSAPTGMACTFECEIELSKLPEPVSLHIFRIIQELITNVCKYARASELKVTICRSNKAILFCVEDNGIGISSKSNPSESVTSGGRGQTNIKERIELIRCYMPVEIEIQNKPLGGTKATIALRVD